MISVAALILAAIPGASRPVTADDYGTLHYLYAGALGDQSCAEPRSDSTRRRRFERRYGERVVAVDRWFSARFSRSELSDALTRVYGNPDGIDTRDCLMKADGTPTFHDTAQFLTQLRSIEHRATGVH